MKTHIFVSEGNPSGRRKRAVAGSAIVLTAAFLLSGCGSAAPVARGEIGVTTEVPAPSGSVEQVRWNISEGEPYSIDPARADLESVSTVVGNLCEGMMRYEPDGSVVNNLAESTENVDDTTLVINLRDDAKFWNGNPVTPADVIFSMERIKDEATASSWAAAYEYVDSIEETGANQVTVRFSAPDVQFKWYLATPAAFVVEKAYALETGESFGSSSAGVMCSGPFSFADWKNGDSLVIEKNEAYWNKEMLPNVDQVEFTFITDSAANTSALVTGDSDGQWMNSPASQGRLDSSGMGKVLYGESLSPVFIAGFVDSAGMKVPEVRDALRQLIDYQGIVDGVYAGTAVPIKTKTPPATWGYAHETYQKAWDALPDPVQNLDAARELMSKAGTTDELTIAYDNSNQALGKIALSVQASGKEVGLKIVLKAMPPNEYNLIFSEATAREGIDAYLVRGYLDFPEPLQYDLYRTSGHYYNYVGYNNPEYDALLAEASRTLDDEKRAELVTSAEALWYKDSYDIPIASPYVDVFVNKSLTGLVPSQFYLYTAWAASLGAA